MDTTPQVNSEAQHFDPKGNLPSATTIEFQKALRRSLPFEDQRDFEEAQRGFMTFCCRALIAFLTVFIPPCSARPY